MQKNKKKNNNIINDNNAINIKVRLLSATREFIRILPCHILVIGSVFIVAIIFNKYAEAVCFLTAFFSLRYKFDTTYHQDSIVICMALTITMFSLSVILCPPIYMYILASILFAYLDCALLYYIKHIQDLRDIKKSCTEIKLETINEKQLTQCCKLLGYKQDKINIAIMFFVDKMSNVDVWDYMLKNKHNVELDTVRQYKHRMLKDLKKIINTKNI